VNTVAKGDPKTIDRLTQISVYNISNRGLSLRFGVKCHAESYCSQMRPEDSRGEAIIPRYARVNINA
jgi:hypothetical protein